MVYGTLQQEEKAPNSRRRSVTEKRSFEYSDSDMMGWWNISGWLNGVRVATLTRERQQVKNRESG